MKRIILIVLWLVATMTGRVWAYDSGDFQVWNTDAQEIKINDKARFTVEEEFRWQDDAGVLYYQHYDGAFIYALNKHLDVSLSYRHVLEKKAGKFKIENEPNINALLKWDLWGLKFSDRHRLEYRHFDYQTDNWRYRNMLTIRLPWKFTKIEIQPYIADDVFIDLNGMDLNNNRLYGGLSFNIFKNLKAELYYMLQSTRNGRKWTDANVLGNKFKLLF